MRKTRPPAEPHANRDFFKRGGGGEGEWGVGRLEDHLYFCARNIINGKRECRKERDIHVIMDMSFNS